MYNGRLEIITEGKNYAIIDRGTQIKEIAVVHYLNPEKNGWGATTAYWAYECESVGCKISKAEALSKACDLFLGLEKENYISRARLEELATKFKDGLIEDDAEEAMYYFKNECEMEENELKFFEIEEEENEEHYTPSATAGDYSPSHPWDAPGMSISDFI